MSTRSQTGLPAHAATPSTRPGHAPPRLAVRIATMLRRFFLQAADRMMPTHLAVAEHAHHLAAAHILSALADLGVADQLTHGPRTAAELAPVLGCQAEALHRLLRAAAIFDFVKLDRHGRFHQTRKTQVLRVGHPSATADWCRHVAAPAQQAAWGELVGAVRTGDSGFRRAHGTPMFDWLNAHPQQSAHFSAGLGGLTQAEAPAIIASYPFPKTGTVCDVAGGRGVLLAQILHARPGLRGILVESAQVLEQARDYLDGHGLLDRVQLIPGDLFTELDATADLYLLKWILHDWDDAACEKILRNVTHAMPNGSRLLTIEGDQEPSDVHNRFSMIDLVMLVATEGGKERSRQELTELIANSGLRPGRLRTSATDLMLLEATKA
ncbi:MAG: O-methyltransferase [Frankiales bacterium]|nr:O-methyltransferase [Frankiales bacterium]